MIQLQTFRQSEICKRTKGRGELAQSNPSAGPKGIRLSKKVVCPIPENQLDRSADHQRSIYRFGVDQLGTPNNHLSGGNNTLHGGLNHLIGVGKTGKENLIRAGSEGYTTL